MSQHLFLQSGEKNMSPFDSAVNFVNLLKDRKMSAAELLEMYLERIDKFNPEINAVIWQDREGARKLARSINAPPDPEQPLRGIPVTIKEAYDLIGSPTTWGMPELANNVASTDSVVAARLKAAGAIVVGKTNVPFGLADLQSYNEIYGTTNNPWNHEHTPGGSSGGSAAALAAGLSALDMGSDIGGSIRTPAHFCGIFGHKPTWGLIPGRGHAPPGEIVEPDIAVVGPLARSAFDLELQLDVLAGPDELLQAVHYDLPSLGGRGLKGLRVAVWANDDVAPVCAEVEARVYRVADALSDAGAVVEDGPKPAFDSAHSNEVYLNLLWSFMAHGMPDGEFDALKEKAQRAADDDSESVQNARMSTIDHRQWLHYHNERERIRWAWHAFFDSFDLVIAPQTATAAMRHDHSDMAGRTLDVDGAKQSYWQQIFWAGLPGLAWLPSTVIPTGLNDDGLPIGVQIIGNVYRDRITIGVAQHLELAGFHFEAPSRYAH